MDDTTPRLNTEEGKCYQCKAELKVELMPFVATGGAHSGNLRFYYCANSKCSRFKVLVKY